MGKFSFYKASEKDGKNTVTVNLGATVPQGKEVYLCIKARHSNALAWVLFYSNRRTGRTLKTTSWPKRFAKPTVGNPVEYEIVNVIE